MSLSNQIAEIVLKGFRKHYRLYQEITAQAQTRFEQAQWKAVQQASYDRITYYDLRVKETRNKLNTMFDIDTFDAVLWHDVKQNYADLLSFHPQTELAETFYNSVFCHLFERRYFNNQHIFVETTISDNLPAPKEFVYRSYFPAVDGLLPTMEAIIEDYKFEVPFENIKRDIKRVISAFTKQSNLTNKTEYAIRLDILKPLFFRNKAAYIVGRVVSKQGNQPFIIPILNNEKGGLYVDTLVTDSSVITIIFGFSRAYFFVKATAPSALVTFLHDLLPHKTRAELYSSLGFHKQGKTEFYREFLQHLTKTQDKLVIAPGIKGMVMAVFTLPSFPYVFKVIKDKFSPSKEFGRETVLERYQLVKRHDRVGRMADTIEYSDVAFPKNRFDPELLAHLEEVIPGSMEEEDGMIVIKHLYIERRMVPLNMYIETASDDELNAVMLDYGQALKDMISANIFPGDMLLKNFGVTRHGRVIFYDYDEVQYLHDMNFRVIPQARTYEEELSSEPWYSISPGDVFPEQISTFVTAQPKIRRIFEHLHPELMDAAYWKGRQKFIAEGQFEDVYPYPNKSRF